MRLPGGLLTWEVAPSSQERATALARELGISSITASVLLNRGIRNASDGRRFLNPSLGDLHDPDRFEEIEAVVEKIMHVARQGGRIVVYGDYDVDGISSVAILSGALQKIGACVETFIPNRFAHGYGLHADVLVRMARDNVSLVIAVDCGVTAIDAVEQAACAGLDIIILDHHEALDHLPSCCAVIDPKIQNNRYPFRDLCAAGLAFKLAWALGRADAGSRKVRDDFRALLMTHLQFAALATICDVVPLLGENRILASRGLAEMDRRPSAGMRALLKVARLADRKIGTTEVGYQLGPRLNAAGRMEDARKGLELLMTDDCEIAGNLALDLDRINRERKHETARVLAEAQAMLGESLPAFVMLDSASWNMGVVGIVASKISEMLHRPAAIGVVMDDCIKYSARSVPGVHLTALLGRMADDLEHYGGHGLAAGFVVRQDRLDHLRTRLEHAALEMYDPSQAKSVLRIEEEVQMETLSVAVVKELERLSPFGEGNPRPVFMTGALRLAGRPRRMGDRAQHVSFMLSNGRVSVRGVCFGKGGLITDEFLSQNRHRIAFMPKVNHWNGQTNVEYHVLDMEGLPAGNGGGIRVTG